MYISSVIVGKIKDCIRVPAAIDANEASVPYVEQIGKHLVKAQDIVTELMVALDFERGGEIARNLFSIYMFVNRRLMEANVKKERDSLLGIEQLLSELREAWFTVVGRADALNAEPPGNGVNIAG